MNRQMKEMMQQAQKMQQGLAKIQADLAEARVEGSAGLVKATVTGQGELVAIRIPPEALEAGDAEILEDMVLAAVRDAVDRSRDLQESRMKELGLPGLGGLM